MQHDEPVKNKEPLTFWEVLGSTFAGAIGVQSFKNRKRDFTEGNIIHFIIAGILFTAVFTVAMILFVRFLLSGS